MGSTLFSTTLRRTLFPGLATKTKKDGNAKMALISFERIHKLIIAGIGAKMRMMRALIKSRKERRRTWMKASM